jgi:hypothetical protein
LDCDRRNIDAVRARTAKPFSQMTIALRAHRAPVAPASDMDTGRD